ncbi:MAG: acyl-ACP thioesterase domain-containing protein [Coprococcus phoceensis]
MMSRKIDRLCAYRDFELKDEDGEILAIGSSRWILTDTERRRPVRLTEDMAALYESEDRAVFEDEILEPEYSKEMFENAEEMIYNIQRRDIDINMHMHNINYLDAAYEMLPEDVYNNENFNQVRIWYKREIRPQDEVKCRYLYEDNIHYIIRQLKEKFIR